MFLKKECQGKKFFSTQKIISNLDDTGSLFVVWFFFFSQENQVLLEDSLFKQYSRIIYLIVEHSATKQILNWKFC